MQRLLQRQFITNCPLTSVDENRIASLCHQPTLVTAPSSRNRTTAFGVAVNDYHHCQHQRRELSGMMKWALVSGPAASLVSPAPLAALARFEGKGAAQPVNSTSHVYWGEEAAD